MPVGIQRLNAKRSQPNDRIVFIKPIKGPSEKIAQDFLERIAAQCLPVMRDDHLSVVTLEEYEPNPEFVGRNFNAGEVIQLVLKARSGRWLPFEFVQMVMMHELAHCKQMNHSRFFWAVRNQYAEQMRGLWGRGYTGDGIWGRGALLGTGEFQNNAVLPGEPLPEHLCGGTFRSRGRKRKAKGSKPRLSYKEQKERRILKKFGANGVALGADDEAKVKLEKGKKTQAKPRVAGSARGRELRAAAALARFDQQKPKKEEEEEEVRVKIEDGSETESDYEDDPVDVKEEDAVDIDGKQLLDTKGRGMIKVCQDEDLNDQDAQQELRELQSAKRWRQTTLDFKPEQPEPSLPESPDSGAAPRGRQGPGSDHATAANTCERRPTVKTEPEPEPDPQPEPTRRRSPSPSPVRIKREEKGDSEMPRASGRTGRTTETDDTEEKELPCAACSFANPSSFIICTICSNVLCADSMPGAWSCPSSACKGSRYLNPADYGACGVCGQSRAPVAL